MTFERSFWMNRFLLLAVSVLALVLSACRGSPTNPDPDPDPDPHPNELAGTYNGEVTVSDAGLFALTTFTIDNAGNLTGTTTAKDVGDKRLLERSSLPVTEFFGDRPHTRVTYARKIYSEGKRRYLCRKKILLQVA
jgi:hypothetical protein